MANRLQLNFQLESAQERVDFVNNYVQKDLFQSKPLTDAELETIANYVLWGKDEDGLNCTQRKEIQIETKNKTWDRQDTESLDAIMESPTFNEAVFKKPTEARLKIPRETFDRAETLKECPAFMVPSFEHLFKQIDIVDLGINFYELAHGKRTEPPRQSLLKRFDEFEINSIELSASKWNQFKYLKQRHLLVELRREQFTMRDSYKYQIALHSTPEPETEHSHLDFDAEIPVYPLGLIGSPLAGVVFKEESQLNPGAYTDAEISKAVSYYWQKKEEIRPKLFFDFTNLEHVYELLCQFTDVEEAGIAEKSNLVQLIETLKYYIALTDLTEAQKEILDLKIEKVKNQDIADKINSKYGKSYTANYISTIFRQKIIPRINETAAHHAQIIENLTFPENFKACACCGKILLIDAENFVRKGRSKDGFASKCKICDRNKRQNRKV